MKADEGGTFEQPPTGPQAAVLTRIIDIGTHTDTSPQFGEQTRRQVVFMWELAELMSDGRPFTIQAFYTLSMNEKANLRKMLESWRGKAFDVGEDVQIDVAMGKSCMLNVTESATGKSKVGSVSRLPKGMSALEPKGPLLLFRIDEPDWDVFEQLSEFHRKKIESSAEWPKMQGADPATAGNYAGAQAAPVGVAGVPDSDLDDDIPF
jgi:hypothetical protein